ncbi:MAG: ABC transporter substrate-binding protein [Chloroflexota bacterium]|nr:ABC transporter substrate-binding protein [Chloroflexota bacterium]MEE2655977.1 ABC transporter substrate-binding protein [Chloroflexota bacterium]
MNHFRLLLVVKSWSIAILLVAAIFLLACGSSPINTPPQTLPQNGGILVRAHATDPAGFDPVQDSSINTLDLISPIYSQLVRLNPEDINGPLLPELAERWEVGNDGQKITFHLRRNVLWHDGRPFTSVDVASHFNRVISPPSGLFSSQRAPFTDVLDIQTPDPQTVVVVTKHPNAALLRHFAGGHYMIVSEHVMKRETIENPRALRKNPNALIGTGPFTFVSYEPGNSFEVRKNTDYWDEGKPYLDGIQFFIIKDSAARFAALVTGRVHATPSGTASLTPPEAKEIRASHTDTINLIESRGPFWIGASFNATRTPFDDPRVRKALSLAVDHDAYLQLVTGGDGGIGMVGGFSPPGAKFSLTNEELRKLPGYKPSSSDTLSSAQALLEAAGILPGFKLSILVRGDVPVWVNSALFFQDQWSKLGLDVKIEQAEFGTSISRMLKGDFDVRIGGIAFNTPDPDQFLFAPFSSEGPNHMYYPSDPETDRLLAAQRFELNTGLRRELVQKAEVRLISEVVPSVVGHYTIFLNGVRKEVRGWVPRDFMLYNQSRMDTIWLQN